MFYYYEKGLVISVFKIKQGSLVNVFSAFLRCHHSPNNLIKMTLGLNAYRNAL